MAVRACSRRGRSPATERSSLADNEAAPGLDAREPKRRATAPSSSVARTGSVAIATPPSSDRASTSRSSASRARRSTSSSAEATAARSSSSESPWRSASSSSALCSASGVRSSWLASSTKRRSRASVASIRSSISFSVCPRRRSSSFAAGTGSRSCGRRAEIAAARRRIASTGRSAAPAAAYPASEASSNRHRAADQEQDREAVERLVEALFSLTPRRLADARREVPVDRRVELGLQAQVDEEPDADQDEGHRRREGQGHPQADRHPAHVPRPRAAGSRRRARSRSTRPRKDGRSCRAAIARRRRRHWSGSRTRSPRHARAAGSARGPRPARRMKTSSRANSFAESSTSVSPRQATPRGRVETQIADPQLGRALRATAASERPQPRQQLGEGEGLGQVVIGAAIEAGNAVAHGVAGGQHQDRRPDPGLAQSPADLEAVDAGQHQVEDDRVVLDGRRPSRVPPRPRRRRLPPCPPARARAGSGRPSSLRPRRSGHASASGRRLASEDEGNMKAQTRFHRAFIGTRDNRARSTRKEPAMSTIRSAAKRMVLAGTCPVACFASAPHQLWRRRWRRRGRGRCRTATGRRTDRSRSGAVLDRNR